MKRTALAILVLALVAGLIGSAAAQQPPDGSSKAPAAGSPGTSGTTESKSTDVDVNVGGSGTPSSPSTAPGAKAPDVKIDSKTEIRNGGDGSALPRAATGDRTTIFGLSPTAAVILAAALLVVVILAIVAMTRTSTTTIDDHRL
jgi:hypothetical protein